jgi:hypothetical protein
MVHELTAVKPDNLNWELGWMATVTDEAIREFAAKRDSLNRFLSKRLAPHREPFSFLDFDVFSGLRSPLREEIGLPSGAGAEEHEPALAEASRIALLTGRVRRVDLLRDSKRSKWRLSSCLGNLAKNSSENT